MTAATVVGHIGSALTPVVMITVTAIVANGLGDKHAQLANRIRSLTAELRDGATSERRCRGIVSQLRCFDRRLRLAHLAHLLIYIGTLVLVLLVIVLTLENRHGAIDATLFVVGLVCVFVALALGIVELMMANRTMALELEDTVADDPAGP